MDTAIQKNPISCTWGICTPEVEYMWPLVKEELIFQYFALKFILGLGSTQINIYIDFSHSGVSSFPLPGSVA